MPFYTRAFNDLDDPYYACYYGVTTHPLYRHCEACPSFWKCSMRPQFDWSAECSCRCVECGKINLCADIRKQLSAQIQLEQGGKNFKRWRRFCLNPKKHECFGCPQSLYCPKLAEKMNRSLPPMPSLLQRLRNFFNR